MNASAFHRVVARAVVFAGWILLTANGCSRKTATTQLPVAAQIVTLEQINEAAQVWYLQNGSWPTNIEVLRQAGTIPSVPPLPPGRSWVFDGRNHRVFVR